MTGMSGVVVGAVTVTVVEIIEGGIASGEAVTLVVIGLVVTGLIEVGMIDEVVVVLIEMVVEVMMIDVASMIGMVGMVVAETAMVVAEIVVAMVVVAVMTTDVIATVVMVLVMVAGITGMVTVVLLVPTRTVVMGEPGTPTEDVTTTPVGEQVAGTVTTTETGTPAVLLDETAATGLNPTAMIDVMTLELVAALIATPGLTALVVAEMAAMAEILQGMPAGTWAIMTDVT